ncbi:MAG: cobyrinate a,c-diamide synthase [Gammaproteobacteria bacterium]|nr:cobyrinate a,c-diamide synthase [Gammaproteobacteria bacterium]MCP5135901.1 cobyrinate a,c-diamide synthase [Gammaproteobacteria bacterium]
MNRFLLSAAHKSSGKTTLSIGIVAALRARGRRVQAFKKGPDYIDPLWLGTASGRACHNLDFHTQTDAELVDYFTAHASDADIALIEGNMGLFDSIDLEGHGSNAALAALLDTPIILVLDVQGMTRSVIPVIQGYLNFDPNIRIAGLIFNRVGGERHAARLREVVAHYLDLPIVGMVHRDARLNIDEKHLGLVPSNESPEARAKVSRIAEIIASQIDLDALEEIAATSAPLIAVPAEGGIRAPDVRIGIPRDEAFAFYYASDLEALRKAGADLVFFDALRDTALPCVDGLFLGGGFPERHMQELTDNTAMRIAIRQAIDAGLPCYAECGGLMYLSRAIIWDDQRADMVGVIPADVTMHRRPVGRGYTELEQTADAPWPNLETARFPAHEFHYSSLNPIDGAPRYAYKVLRGSGIDGRHDGYLYRNLLASYTHLRDVHGNRWAGRFVEFVRRHKNADASKV